MQLRRFVPPLALAVCTVLVLDVRPADALPPETLDSVVSVLPVWPGRAQGGAGAPPGVAPEGSGVVLRPGVIATAWHVVEPAERIDVRLSDGRILPAELIAADAASDIAVLNIDADLSPFSVAQTPGLAAPVCAVGNAYGLGLSVTCGVVSARSVTNAGFNAVEDFVQTDAATNPGVSGGALVDPEGRLVGMMSAIFASEADSNVGINFAVSSELLQRVVDALVTQGAVAYPRPGWRLRHGDRAQQARVAAPVVEDLAEGGPAARAGVAPGDLILRIGTRDIYTPRDAIAALAILPQATAEVEIVLQRNGDERQITLGLGDGQQPVDAPGETEILGECPHPDPVCALRQAVFPVSSFDPVGSATRIGPDLLVTNRHVVGDRPDAVVHTPDGPRGGRVVPSAYDGDLVLLEVPGLPETGLIPDLDSEVDAQSEAYFTVGADISRQEVRVFEPGALIATPAEGAPLGRLHVSARMQPGVSGGALVDEDGDLVGIAVGGGEGRFEAIPLDGVRALLAGREAEDAEARHVALSTALVACAESLDAVRQPQDGALETLADTCAAAQNHGQLLEAGRALAGAGEFGRAATLHGQAVDQVPNSINARLSLLVSLQLGGRFDEMIPHAQRLMEMAPDDPQALRFAIQSGVWGGDAELAEAGYDALLAADPRQAEAARRFIDTAPPAPPRR
ncbi:MAG: trypsin-like peptidase domain-containing protein [Rhodobacteraceae bacterium]|nr:trypsin-like peptidase domain-containing protein [Paracoccaceae bacterium]